MNDYKATAHLTRDPELKVFGTTTVTKFGIAVNNPYKKDDVSFFECECFNKTAEFVSKYFTKGKAILIESARLQQQRWETDNKEKRSKVVIIVDKVDFLGSKGDSTPAAQTVEKGGDFFPIDDDMDSDQLPF